MKFQVNYKSISMNIQKKDNGYWFASSNVLSISRVGTDLEKLIQDFGDYLDELYTRLNKLK